MLTFQIYDYLQLSMLIMAIVGFIGLISTLILFINSKVRNKPVGLSLQQFYGVFAFFSFSISFFILFKFLMLNSLKELSDSEISIISVYPQIHSSKRELLKSVSTAQFFYNKSSGSHPTNSKWEISVCVRSDCTKIEFSQDSRDKDLYWVSYKGNENISRFDLGKINLKGVKL